MNLVGDLRASTGTVYNRPQLLGDAADRIDELEALVERQHGLIERLERTLLLRRLR